MEQYLPCTALQPFVKHYLIIDSDQGMQNRILPDTSIVMAFRLAGQIAHVENGTYHNLPLSVITGIRESSRLISYSKNASALLVAFKEGGASAFFKEPLHELSGMSISLDHLVQGPKIHAIEEQLAQTPDNRKRVKLVEQFLLSELKKTQGDLLIGEAIQKIKFSKGDIKIKDLLADLPISRDPFEKRFRRITGTSPKQFSGIVRLKNLISSYSGSTSLTEMAYDAGYFDQAHFIKDFRSFTGQTPHDFFRNAIWW